MATALLPYGAAYSGATQELLDAAKQAEGDAYLPTVFNPSTLTEKGRRTLAKARVPRSKDGKEGFECYYEIHGKGPTKVVFVMGLNNSCFGWLPQVEKLGSDGRYSVLVLDNRGVGNSDTPSGLYKTSEMAIDTIELLEQLGWTEPRSIHLAGVSMGGMISLELARQRPDLLASLTLISTAPGKRYGTPHYGLRSLVRVLGGRVVGFDSEAYRLNRLIETLFPIPWLEEKSKWDQNQTNRRVLFKMFAWRYQFTRRQTLHGAVAQMKAAVTHNVSDASLKAIDAGVPKITILTGDVDYLVDPRNSQYLADHMPSAELIKFTNAGHALGSQYDERVNTILERVIKEGQESSKNGGARANL